MDEEAPSDGSVTAGFTVGSYYVLECGVFECNGEMGLISVQNQMDALNKGSETDKELQWAIIETIADFSLKLVEIIQEILLLNVKMKCCCCSIASCSTS